MINTKNKKIFINLFISFFLIAFFIFPISSVSAAGLVPCGDSSGDPCTFEDFFTLIGNVLDYITGTLTYVIALLWFGFAAYKMMLSQGDPSKFNEGKSMILYGIIGIIVIFSAPIIIKGFLRLIGAQPWVEFFFSH
ncbi:MAG: pilin [Candidatus Pacebacteria bacterium]|nr:pilin [Candidatus Paceibacterota bacterium]